MTDSAQTVHVSLGERSYDIEIGTNNLAETGSFVTGLGRVTNAFVITDTNVENPHANLCADSLVETGADVDVLVSYLPVGSEDATRWYAEQAIEAGVAFVNAIRSSRRIGRRAARSRPGRGPRVHG